MLQFKAKIPPRTRIAHAFVKALFAHKDGCVLEFIRNKVRSADASGEYECTVRVVRSSADEDLGRVFAFEGGPFTANDLARDMVAGSNEAVMANQALAGISSGDEEFLIFFAKCVSRVVRSMHIDQVPERDGRTLRLCWVASYFEN